MLAGMKTGKSIATAEFPPELWVEILVRLPAKALVRFRCVSKTWRSIVDNPKFIHMHLNLSKNNPNKNLLLSWEHHKTEMCPQGVVKIMVQTMDEFRNVEQIMSLTSLPGGQAYNSEKVTIPFLLSDAFAILDISSASACLWVFKQCGGSKTDSWSKWSEGPSDSDTLGLFQQHYYRMCRFETLYSEEIRRFLLAMAGDEIGDQMKSYDIENGLMKDLDTSPRGHMLDLMGPYVESLLLANASGGHSWTSIPEENRFRRFDPCTP